MNLLAAQIADNATIQSPLLVIGITALVISVLFMLWKNEAKSAL